MASNFTAGRYHGWDDSGNPLSGGLLYTYAAGTLTPLATYTTQAGGVANANPVVLDSAGRAPVWIGASSYRFILKTSAGVTVEDDDNISSPASAIDLSASSGSSLVGYLPAGTGGVATTVQTALRRRCLNLLDYGGVADGAFTAGGSATGTDNLAAINVVLAAAVVLGFSVEIPGGGYYFSAGFTIPKGVEVFGHGKAWLAGYLGGTNRGTRLLINGAAAGDCVKFAENGAHSTLRNLSVFNTNTNTVTVINITGHLHPVMEDVEYGSLRASAGVGLLLDSSASSPNYETLYGQFRNVVCTITEIGTANEASIGIGLKINGTATARRPNANQFFGGVIAGKTKAMEMTAAAAASGALNCTFHGTLFEGVYNTGMTHVFVSGGTKIVGYSLASAYIVRFVDIADAFGASFTGCYFELGGLPVSYNDGVNGAAPIVGAVYLDNTTDVQMTEMLSCTWNSVFVYDGGLNTVVNPTFSGHRYDTRNATSLLVRQNGAQAIPNAAYTKVTFGSVFEGDDAYLDWDAGNNYAIVKTQGVYLIAWQVTMAGWATATTYVTSRCVAQANNHQGTYAPAGGAAVPMATQGQCMVTLEVGDTIYVDALHNQGGSQNTTGASAETRLNITKIA